MKHWNSPTWLSWRGAMHRCYRKKDKDYPNYGGRGIKVCEFIRRGPESIMFLIGKRPDGKTIDRIESHSNYSCGRCGECISSGWDLNVRWSTPLQQARNRRKSTKVSAEDKFLSDIAKEVGVSYNTILRRFEKQSNLYAKPKSTNRKIEVFGEWLTMSEISKKWNIPYNTVKTRLSKGMNNYELITTPKGTGRHGKKTANAPW